MSRASWLNYVFLANVSTPQADRQLYRLVKKHRVGKIFELGIEDLDRTWRLLSVAARYTAAKTIKYAAVDEFEARRDGLSRLPLIEAHRMLQQTAATVRLVPGPPAATLAGVANSHLGTDLVLISSCHSDEDLAQAWNWMPRMLHAGSIVVRTSRGSDGSIQHRLLTPAEVSRLAEQSIRRVAA